MTAMTKVYGGRMFQARTLRSIPSGVLATHLDWPANKMTRLERKYQSNISVDELACLQDMLRVSPDFLTTPPVSTVQERDLLFRTVARTTRREKVYLTQLVGAIEEVIDLATQQRPFPPIRLPRRPNPSPVEAAAEARAALNLGADEPIASVTHVIEKGGIPVIMRTRALAPTSPEVADIGTTTERHSGLSAWVGRYADQPVIVLQAMKSWERTRWTLAHELGHICLHRHLDEPNAEAEANDFANEFLAPIAALKRDLPRAVTLTSLADLKMKWGISIGALIMHLARHGAIDPDRKDTLQRQIYTRKNPETGRSWGLDEPGWDARRPERPRMLMKWLENTLGTTNPLQMAAFGDVVLPGDLLQDLLSHQRTDADDPSQRQVPPSVPELPSLATVSVLGQHR